jgi:hypothetical protein
MYKIDSVDKMGSGINSPEALMMFEQFGRIGNSGDGQAFNRVREADETQLIDVAGNDIYIGYALPGSGTSTSAAIWKIKRINTVNPISIFWADSSTLYNKVWDDRATSYTYL